MVFNDEIEVITKTKRIIYFFCEESSHGSKTKQKRKFATEDRRSISICHGLTRNYTEKTEAETRKRHIQFIEQKLQMEELQWGFPITTPLS